MGFFSGISHGFGNAIHSISNDIGDPFDGVEDWLTGSSGANRGYRYQSALQSAAQGFNSQEAEKSYERQKELMRLQDQISRSYFDYVADYNTPAGQMARLREAGLNPHLVYGNGAMATQAATSMAHAPTASQASAAGIGSASGGVPGSLGSFLGGLSSVLGAWRDYKQSQLVDAQKKLVDAQASGQALKNIETSRDNLFGHGRVGQVLGDIYRSAQTFRTMFPEQFDMVRDWASNKLKTVFGGKQDSSILGDMMRSIESGLPKRPSVPVQINQWYGSGPYGDGRWEIERKK